MTITNAIARVASDAYGLRFQHLNSHRLVLLKYTGIALGTLVVSYVVYKRLSNKRSAESSQTSTPAEVVFGAKCDLGRTVDEFVANLHANHEKYLLLLQRLYPDECSLTLNSGWSSLLLRAQRRLIFLNSASCIRKYTTTGCGSNGCSGQARTAREPFVDRPRNFLLAALSAGYLGSFFRMYDAQLRDIRAVIVAGLRQVAPLTNSGGAFESCLNDEIASFCQFLDGGSGDQNNECTLIVDAPSFLQQITTNLMLTVAVGKRFEHTASARSHIQPHIANMSALVGSLNIVELERFDALDACLFKRSLFQTVCAALTSVRAFVASALVDYATNTFDKAAPARTFADQLIAKQQQQQQHKSSSSEPFSADDNLAHAFALLMIGVGSLGFTLSWAFFYLARDKHVQERLYAELVEQGVSEQPHVMLKDKSTLPYTNACVSEILRLSSTHPLIVRSTPPASAANSSLLPADTTVVLNAYAVHHDANYWKDGDKFEPNRWIDAEESRASQESYMPFGIGSRVCLGQEMSRAIIFSVVANLVRLYQFEYVAHAGSGASAASPPASAWGVMRRPHSYDLKLARRV